MRKFTVLILVVILCLSVLCGCTQNQPDVTTKIPDSGIDYADVIIKNNGDKGTIGGEYSISDTFEPSGRYDSEVAIGGKVDATSGWYGHISSGHTYSPSGNGSNESFQIPAGQITCGALCDQENYDFWLSLFNDATLDANQQTVAAGLFNQYLSNNYGFNTLHRVKVTVVNDANMPVPYANVQLKNSDSQGNAVFSAVTNANGVAYLYAPNGGAYAVTATKDEATADVAVHTADNNDVTLTLAADTDIASVIDVLFVVDTTGSMGDEINYLKAEIADTVDRIKQSCGDVTVRIGLLFYRDHGDDYITRLFDFNDDLTVVQANLSAQYASGGGDYEEAVDEALLIAAKGYTKDGQTYAYSWSENSTKVLVHVLDAPIHDGQEYQSRYNEAVNALAQMGVRVVTVAASGVNTKCQYTFRSVSMLTGGKYVFITDHSGIGSSHEVPETQDYVVEYLNDCLIRLLAELHTGIATEPTPITAQQ